MATSAMPPVSAAATSQFATGKYLVSLASAAHALQAATAALPTALAAVARAWHLASPIYHPAMPTRACALRIELRHLHSLLLPLLDGMLQGRRHTLSNPLYICLVPHTIRLVTFYGCYTGFTQQHRPSSAAQMTPELGVLPAPAHSSQPPC